MFPCAIMNDIPQSSSMNMKHCTYCFKGVSFLNIHFANFKNFCISHFGCMAFLANIHMIGAMFAPVKLIVTQRIPTKIFKEVVNACSIIMTGLHPFWTRTNEGSKDQDMDTRVMPPGILTQDYPWIPCGLCGAKYVRLAVIKAMGSWLKIRLYFSVIGNFVSWKSWNFFPNFFGDGILRISHGGSLLFRESLRLEPVRRYNAT